MYAIVFDLDTDALKANYHNDSYNNAYKAIGVTLASHGFKHQQGSVYFGDDTVNAVTCVMAIMDLARNHDWFEPSVSDVRMLRIEDNNDLMPAVTSASDGTRKKKAG